MQRSAEQLTLAAANTATGSTVFLGGMAFLNEYAAAIGALCAIVSLIIAIIFYVLNYRIRKRELEIRRQRMIEDVIYELKKEQPHKATELDEVKEEMKTNP